MAGDLMGMSSENSAWNLVGFDEDVTQRTFLRRRRLINGSTVFADLPRVSDVVNDFTHDTSPTRFSVAVQLAMDLVTTTTTTTTTTAAATTTTSADVTTTVISMPTPHNLSGALCSHAVASNAVLHRL